MGFSKDFAWGAATASYQIEGAAFSDGKGLSIWDMLCMKEGAIRNGSDGFTACDHYHKYREDVSLMSEINLRAYRLSVSWPRILPDGVGAVNQKGLDFYDRLIDELLKHNIDPWVTLYHWDYPRELFLRGGWLNRETVNWFADYVSVVVDRLSDRVSNWITLNEIQGFVGFGYASGGKFIQAPALDLGLSEVLLVGHNALISHGKAVQIIRSSAKKTPVIGDAPVGLVTMPASDEAGDIKAAYNEMFAIKGRKEDFFKERSNSWWMDPVHLGHYPEDGLRIMGDLLPKTFEKDMAEIYQPLDYCGVNIYSGTVLSGGGEVNQAPGSLTVSRTPECLYWGPRYFHERYKLPVVITENGISCKDDSVSADGKVHDPQRIEFLEQYLRQYKRAADDNIPVKGYFLWSLMDNFEWCGGYTPRYGIIHVNYSNQKRTLKDSAFWYKEVISSNGSVLDN